LALRGVGRESEAESVRFHGRRVTKVGPEVKHGLFRVAVGRARNPKKLPPEGWGPLDQGARGLALKGSDHCLLDMLDYVTSRNRNLLKIRSESPKASLANFATGFRLTTALWHCGLHRTDRKILRFSVGFQFQKADLFGGLEQIVEGLKAVRALVEARIAPL
jgi:hypothetical protein